MKEELKTKVWLGVFLLWGVLTGRCLPQWEDIARTPYWFGETLIFWIMIIIGLIIIFNYNKLKEVKSK